MSERKKHCICPWPSCGSTAVLTKRRFVTRRGGQDERRVEGAWLELWCPNAGYHGSNAAQTEHNKERRRLAIQEAWRKKYGEDVPSPIRGGRPTRSSTGPSQSRVFVSFTTDELAQIDRECDRRDVTRSDVIRDAVLAGFARETK
jgi:hypothetical protein